MPNGLPINSSSLGSSPQSVISTADESNPSYCSRLLRCIQPILCCRRNMQSSQDNSNIEPGNQALGDRPVSSVTLVADDEVFYLPPFEELKEYIPEASEKLDCAIHMEPTEQLIKFRNVFFGYIAFYEACKMRKGLSPLSNEGDMVNIEQVFRVVQNTGIVNPVFDADMDHQPARLVIADI